MNEEGRQRERQMKQMEEMDGWRRTGEGRQKENDGERKEVRKGTELKDMHEWESNK